MDGICYSHTNNIKLSTAESKHLKWRHICNKKVTASIIFLNRKKVKTFQILWTFDHINYKSCWAESSHSKLFLTSIFTTEYYPLNPHCLNIKQNDNIKQHNPVIHLSTHLYSLHICKTYNSVHSKLYSYHPLCALWMITVSQYQQMHILF